MQKNLSPPKKHPLGVYMKAFVRGGGGGGGADSRCNKTRNEMAEKTQILGVTECFSKGQRATQFQEFLKAFPGPPRPFHELILAKGSYFPIFKAKQYLDPCLKLRPPLRGKVCLQKHFLGGCTGRTSRGVPQDLVKGGP